MESDEGETSPREVVQDQAQKDAIMKELYNDLSSSEDED
jgi:hypothetical protein